jgi:hypothetical protein
MTTDMQKKIERTHDALFGVIGEPDKSLMVQILQTVKEVKAIRMSHDKIVPQVQENTRTNRNIIRLMWLVVGLILTTVSSVILQGGLN